MNEKLKNSSNIFEVLREKISLKDYCENELGLNFRESGNSFRATPATGGLNSFSIWKDDLNHWYDFAQQKGGDIVNLCANENHNGEIKEAVKELAEKYLSENEREKYLVGFNQWIKERNDEQEKAQNAKKYFHSGQYAGIKHWPDYLHKRGLDDSDIERLGLGFEVNEFRLFIPYYDYDGVTVLTHKARRMPNSNGQEDESSPKYKQTENNSFIKNRPIGLQTLKRNGILILTEGDFDYFMFEKAGYACLGKIEGNQNWNRILNIIESRNEIYLAYDNDNAGREFTIEAARKLFQRDIKFFVIELPENCKDVNDFIVKNGGKIQDLIENAIDGLSYIASTFKPSENDTRAAKREKEKKLKEFLTQCYSKQDVDGADIQKLYSALEKVGYDSDWLKEVKKKAEKGETEYEIVEAILRKYEILYNEATGFYVYNRESGIWEHCEESLIKKYIRQHLGTIASARKLYAITEHLKGATSSKEPIKKFNRNQIFGFKNQTLHFKGQELRSFESADFLTHRVNYDYDASAKCENWEKAVYSIFANDERRVRCFQEFCGYCLITHNKYHKALILRDKSGNGCNGKSTLLNVLKYVFGAENCTNLQPYQFADKFSIIHLKDSKVNICSDCDNDIREAIPNLKTAISGETLNGCYKNKDFIQFDPLAKIIFAVNGGFNAKGVINGALTRRLLLIDCPVQFVDSGEEDLYHVKRDKNIEEKLLKECAGIFNWCLIGAKRLIQNEGIFTETDEQAELTTVFTTETEANSVNNFVDLIIDDDSQWKGQNVKIVDVYTSYIQFCADRNINAENVLSNRKFFGAFEARLKAKEIQFKRWRPHGEKEMYSF